MTTLKQILFAVAVTICFSITASAQRDGDKPPPKEKPPVIVVQPDKKPTPEKPKDDRKKPNSEIFYLRKQDSIF